MRPRPRRQLVRRIIAEKRRQHPELRSTSIRFDDVCAILDREDIMLHWYPPGVSPAALGKAIAFLDAHCIFLNPSLSGELLVAVALHELGHCHLGHCQEIHELPIEVVRRHSARSEAEADFYAELLLGRDALAESNPAHRSVAAA